MSGFVARVGHGRSQKYMKTTKNKINNSLTINLIKVRSSESSFCFFSTENAPVVVVPSPSGHNQATMVLSAELRETRDRQLTPGDRERREEGTLNFKMMI